MQGRKRRARGEGQRRPCSRVINGSRRSALMSRVWLVEAWWAPRKGYPPHCFNSVAANVAVSDAKARSCQIFCFSKGNLELCPLPRGLPASSTKFLASLGCSDFPFLGVGFKQKPGSQTGGLLHRPHSLHGHCSSSAGWNGGRRGRGKIES